MKDGVIATDKYYYRVTQEGTLIIADKQPELYSGTHGDEPVTVEFDLHIWQRVTYIKISASKLKKRTLWATYLTKPAVELVDKVLVALQDTPEKGTGKYMRVWVPEDATVTGVENALNRSGIKARARSEWS